MKKRIISLILILCLCTPLCSFANEAIEVSINGEDYSINITGNLGEDAANRLVTLALVSPGKSVSSIDIENYPKGKTDVISDFYITTSNDDGYYEFLPFTLSSNSGDYTICVSADNLSSMKSIVKYLPSKVQLDTIVENIEKGDADDIFDELKKEETKTAVANIADISIYYSIDDKGKEVVCNKLDEKSEYKDFGEIAKIIITSSLIYDITTTKKSDELYNYLYNKNSGFDAQVEEILNGLLNYDEKKELSVLADFEKLDDSTKLSVLESASKIDKSDIEEFYDALMISVINYEFGIVDNWAQISEYIQKYYKDCLKELDYVKYRNLSYRSDIDKSLVKKSFESVSALCSYINDFVPTISSSGSSGFGSQSGSSSKGGGGSSSGSSFGVALPQMPVEEDVKEENNKDINTVFNDVKDFKWANDAILHLYEKKIIDGVGDNKFAPKDYITREAFVKMLVEILGVESEADISFDDVDKNNWAHKYIAKAVGAKIVNGISETQFGLGTNITREDMAVLISRIFDDEKIDFKNEFNDFEDVSEYAKEHLLKVASLKIINGYGDKTFKPKALCTRAEAAIVIYKTLMLIEEGK